MALSGIKSGLDKTQVRVLRIIRAIDELLGKSGRRRKVLTALKARGYGMYQSKLREAQRTLYDALGHLVDSSKKPSSPQKELPF